MFFHTCANKRLVIYEGAIDLFDLAFLFAPPLITFYQF